MSFIRTDKPPGSPPDALDQALTVAAERLRELPPNARAGPAGSLVRDFSEVAQAGGSVEARAAAVFVRTLTSRLSDDELENIRTRVGQRTADIVELTHDSRRDGPRLPMRVRRRLERIDREDDADARLVIERVVLREASVLARNHERLMPANVAELASALHVVAESPVVDRSVAASVAELLASTGLVVDTWPSFSPQPLYESGDPRVLSVGHCFWDEQRPYLTWHRDLGALAETLIEGAEIALAGDALAGRRRELRLTAEAWRAGGLSDADARSEIVRRSPLSSEWIGTFEQLRLGDDEFVREIRAWYWDDDPKDDPIPDRLLEDFIEVIRHYGDV